MVGSCTGCFKDGKFNDLLAVGWNLGLSQSHHSVLALESFIDDQNGSSGG